MKKNATGMRLCITVCTRFNVISVIYAYFKYNSLLEIQNISSFDMSIKMFLFTIKTF